MKLVETPKQTTCEAVAELLAVSLHRTVKSIALMANDNFYLLLLRGDHSLNEIKVGKLNGLADFRFCNG
jgi:prolyl-tRNA synthetase